MSAMLRANLQPKVALRQQLIRALPASTLQPMVVSADKVKADFARRLHSAIEASGRAPTDRRGWRGWIAKRYGVSVESARKWLVGEAIPDTSRLAVIAIDLGASVDHLLTGSEGIPAAQPYLSRSEAEMLEAFRAAPAPVRTAAKQVVDLGAVQARAMHGVSERAPEPARGAAPASTPTGVDVVLLKMILEQVEALPKLSASQRAQLASEAYAALAGSKKPPTRAAVLRLVRTAS